MTQLDDSNIEPNSELIFEPPVKTTFEPAFEPTVKHISQQSNEPIANVMRVLAFGTSSNVVQPNMGRNKLSVRQYSIMFFFLVLL